MSKCRFKYRGEYCGYTGEDVKGQEGYCGKTLDDCKTRWKDLPLAFGGLPSVKISKEGLEEIKEK